MFTVAQQSPATEQLGHRVDDVENQFDDEDEQLRQVQPQPWGRQTTPDTAPIERPRDTSTLTVTAREVEDDHISCELPDLISYELPQNVYGLVIFTFPRFGNAQFPRGRLWCVAATLLLAVSLVLEIGICWIVIVAPEHYHLLHYDKLGLSNITDNIRKAVEMERQLDDTDLDPKSLDFCNKEHASVRGVIPIYYLVIFVWVGRMMQDLSDLTWQFFASLNISAPPYASTHAGRYYLPVPDAVSTSDGATGAHVDEKLCSRCWCILLGVVRFVTFSLVLSSGIRFLVLSRSTYSLIIKCLAFRWIVTIPELLFQHFVPTQMRERMKRIPLHFQRPKWIKSCEDRFEDGWSTIVRLIIVGLVTVFVLKSLVGKFHGTVVGEFHDIMNFRYECQKYALLSREHGWGVVLRELGIDTM
jgi:hypothetical protein